MSRSIIHVDLDAFFASVEERENPAIRGQPIIVGADPKGRGVVAAASYAARRYGVHSAMPIRQAARLCPHAVFLPVRHELYGAYSRRVMRLLGEYTSLLEQVSIDEAFLDVTGSQALFGPVDAIGRAIQRRIRDEIGLPCTVGIASNKLLAKVGSESGKPGGFVVVHPGQEAPFLAPLPVGNLWGVGPKTAQRLKDLGIFTIGELAALPVERLQREFGRPGLHLHQRANGVDESPVEAERARKSLSQEHTFAQDTSDPAVVEAKLLELAEQVGGLLRRECLRARTVALKLRYGDFTTLTRSTTLHHPTDLEAVLYTEARKLLRREWTGGCPVRLVGVGASNLLPTTEVQPGLFDLAEARDQELARAVDAIRQRHGDGALRRGATLRPRQ